MKSSSPSPRNHGSWLTGTECLPEANVTESTQSTGPQSFAAERVPAAAQRERRVQARHPVDTSAIDFLVKIGLRLQGRIIDLSLGGCRIRTDERFPVGIYTRAETEFRLQGLPFRLGGVVQAIHDRNTVGIRFLDLSERKRQQVLELIGEMEQMRAEEAADGKAESHAGGA